MKTTTKNLLRWIALLPGALLGGILSNFPLHWLLLGTLTYGSTVSGMDISGLERNLMPFVGAVFFILSGYYIAPHSKRKSVIGLAMVYVMLWILLFNLYDKAVFQWRSIGALVGLLLGLLIAHRYESSLREDRDIS